MIVQVNYFFFICVFIGTHGHFDGIQKVRNSGAFSQIIPSPPSPPSPPSTPSTPSPPSTPSTPSTPSPPSTPLYFIDN